MAIQDSHETTLTFSDSTSDSTPEPVGSHPMPTTRRGKLFNNVVTLLLLVTIMAAGGYFRFVGQNWDDYTHLHPDERFLTDVASRIAEGNLSVSGVDKQYFGSPEEQNAACFSRYPTTNGDGDFFDSQCSTWYPKNNGGFGLYVYGELPLFTVKIAARLTRWVHESQAATTADPLDDQVARAWTSYEGVHLVGRSVSAVADMIAIFFLFLIGTRLYNKWVGLLAAAFYAASVLPIQLSHFWTADAFTALPVVIALYFAVRAADTGKWRDFIGFGIFMGASIASRINVLPLIGVIGLSAILYALPVLDATTPRQERNRLLAKMFVGLMLAVLFTLVAFRFTMPHAFKGGPGLGGIININPYLPAAQTANETLLQRLNPFYGPWLDDIAQAQYLTSGKADIPPNHQWASRTPYLFAWWNMVAFGMGLPLGLLAWVAFGWGAAQMIRAQPGWTRHVIPIVWVLVYFGLMGRVWVMAMRYYLPIYPFLCLLAAWMLVELVTRARRYWMTHQTRGRFVATGASLALVAVLLATVGYATMFTQGVYGRMLSRVAASHWVFRNLPAAFSAPMTLTANEWGTGGETRLYNFPIWAETMLQPGQAGAAMSFTADATGTIAQIDVAHLKSVNGDAQSGLLSVSITAMKTNQPLGKGSLQLTDLTSKRSIFGDSVTIQLEAPITLEKGADYQIQASLEGGSPIQITGTAIATEGPWDDPLPYKVCDMPLERAFSRDIPSGLSSVATCRGIDPWNVTYKGLELYMAAEDDQQKRDIMQKTLDEADYVTMSSNRFYDSLSRIPMRFPMSIKFYDAMFKGELGFELAEDFTGYPRLGSFEIADQNLPFYNAPKFLNELEAEESFHVYDHPAVLIFRKTDKYSSAKTADLLNGLSIVDGSQALPLGNENPNLVNVLRWGAQPSSAAPSAFSMSPDLEKTQAEGGTFSDLFGRTWLLNQSQPLAVAVWWLTIIVFGLAIFPMLYMILPGLPDRGYGLAKIAGLLVVSWIVWVGGTLKLPTWSNWGILLTLVGVLVFGLLLVWRRRAEFFAYVRTNWRHFIVVELIALIMFAAFIVVRLTNPDLWHPSFGGEKPMDFAYFNAVLRSSVFPPYDPWYSGGYLNYYYYGFVLVGTPVKLLGITPAVAYNLCVATVFALTGIGAFSLAFNLTAGRWFFQRDQGSEAPRASLTERLRFSLNVPAGSPYVAGVMAMLLCVVLGNLHTPAVAMEGIANLGGCSTPISMGDWKYQQFRDSNGREPTGDEGFKIDAEAVTPSLGDQVSFASYMFQRNGKCLSTGFSQLTQGALFPLGTNRWFWAARSIVGELPNASSEINEFPIFTFVYGDLHAHMIAMPITLLVIGWLLAEVMIGGRQKRPTWVVLLATALGGVAVGILRPTNTWDWVTYLALGVLGLLFTMYLRRDGLRRARLIEWGAQLAVFIAAQQLAAQPFLRYFATSYSSIKLFEGNKTPLWAYIDMHGLFLFFIVSFLVWQTARVLRNVYVRDFVRRRWVLIGLIGFVGAAILLTIIVAMFPLKLNQLGSLAAFPVQVLPIPLGWIAIPILCWCGLLFLLPEQSREIRVIDAMIGLAMGLTMAVEIVVLEGDIARQNTFFKFYMQIWFLFAIVGGVAAAWLLRASERWITFLRAPWMTVTVILLMIAGLYPIMATQAKAIERFSAALPLTLNGNDYMEVAQHYQLRTVDGQPQVLPLKADLEMIHWLQDNVKGTPVILEARLYPSEYQWNTRIAINTGFPTVVGWNFHQKQQRTLDPLPMLVEQRGNNVEFMYDSADILTVWDMLSFYKVRYIILGGLERASFKPEGLGKFEAMVKEGLLKVVYEQGEDRIYEVQVGKTPAPLLVGSLPTTPAP